MQKQYSLHPKRFPAGKKKFDSDDELKDSVAKWLTCQTSADCYEQGIQNLGPVTRASVWVVIMSKSRLRCVEFDDSE